MATSVVTQTIPGNFFFLEAIDIPMIPRAAIAYASPPKKGCP